MNKKIRILGALCIMLTLNLFAQEQKQKNIIGVGAGFSPEREAYVNAPPYIWVGLNSSPVFQVFYARQLLEAVRLGSYFEYQNATLKNINSKVSRYNVGFNWLCQYPNTSFHAQLGGYFGYGSLKADNWDQALSGTDYGIMIGPAYEKDNFGIALHFQCGFGYYTSSGVPNEVDFSIPRFMLKVYYKF